VETITTSAPRHDGATGIRDRQIFVPSSHRAVVNLTTA
jgi:hypothetical protein